MERFIACENIRRFKAQLADCTNATSSATLRKLLAEEEAHLARLDRHIPETSLKLGSRKLQAWPPLRLRETADSA